jgi:hypothetical protein
MIGEDQRVKVREIAEVTGIAKSTVHEIIPDLNFRKLSAHWVPKMLTEKHKCKCKCQKKKKKKKKKKAASLENLCSYQDEGEFFAESIITGDETWVYEFTPESRRNSMTWKQPHSHTTKEKNPN